MAFDRWLSLAAALAISIFIALLCDFAIIESDWFWHVAAGDLMRATGGLIHTDPFSWTREGLPYGSNHEWLAQVLFSVVAGFDTHAEILLRTTVVAATTVLLMTLGGRLLWLGLPLAMIVLSASIGGFMDRPQILTFLMLACSLWVAMKYLSGNTSSTCGDTSTTAAGRRPAPIFLFLFPIIQILWINLHGAAAILNVMIVGALLVQEGRSAWRSGWADGKRPLIVVIVALIALLPASLISPMGTENITYLLRLNADATVQAIQEWRPRELAIYIKALWPVYLIAIGALAWGRRNIPFMLLVALPMIYLSRQAYRHEMLLSFALLAITMDQLRAERVQEFFEKPRMRMIAVVAVIVLAIPLGFHAKNVKYGFLQRNHAFGDVRDRVGPAVAFAQGANVDLTKPFNTYNLGSELDGHLLALGGKTFVDGRNIDFGDEFLTRLFAAGATTESWNALEQEYGFTTALIDISDSEPMPYISHLRDNPSWVLVFMDDFTAVYLKDVTINHPTIQQSSYRFIDPTGFRRVATPNADTVAGIETELKRAIAGSPNNVSATILLARLYGANSLVTQAESLLRGAIEAHPLDYRPHEELALLLTKTQRFAEAADAFDTMLALLGTIDDADVRTGIAEAFTKAGGEEWAGRY